MAKKNEAPQPTATYTCKAPIKHDGKKYIPGESIELTAAAAEKLAAIGGIAPEDNAAAKKAAEEAAAANAGETDPGAPAAGGA